MRRFRIYFGNHSMRSFDTEEAAVAWADRFLKGHHVNVFDRHEYLYTLHL